MVDYEEKVRYSHFTHLSSLSQLLCRFEPYTPTGRCLTIAVPCPSQHANSLLMCIDVQSKMLRRQAEERLRELQIEVESLAASRQQPQTAEGGVASLQTRLAQAISSIQEGLVERDTEV